MRCVYYWSLGHSSRTSLTLLLLLLLSIRALGIRSGGLKLVTILELIVHALVLNTFGYLKLDKIVIVTIDDKISYNYQVLESVIMTHNDHILNLMLLRSRASLSENYVIVALDDHIFDSGSDFNSAIMAIDREIFNRITHSLLTIMLVDGIRIH